MINTEYPTNAGARRKSGARGKPLTSVLAYEIKKLAATTELMQHQIAALLGLNQGRVSEVLTGKRFSEVAYPTKH